MTRQLRVEYADAISRMMGRPTIWLMSFALSLTSQVPAAEPAFKAELVAARKIWDQGKHNAFTDLIRFKGQWFCVFREGAGHVSPEGKVRVLRCADGTNWQAAALVERTGYDLRDPKIEVAPGGTRLMITGGATVREGNQPATLSQSFVSFSSNGLDWDPLRWVGPKDRWLWRVTWFGGKAYGVDYDVSPPSRAARHYGTSLLQSDDGTAFKTIVPELGAGEGATEATLRFGADGTAYCLQRRDGKNNSALLGRSAPPYQTWQWQNLGFYFGGPNFIALPNGRWVAAGRLLKDSGQPGPKTAVCELDVNGGKLTPLLVLPSGGDTSYPGLVWHNGLLWISYYSSHEGKTAIYLAQVRLGPAP